MEVISYEKTLKEVNDTVKNITIKELNDLNILFNFIFCKKQNYVLCEENSIEFCVYLALNNLCVFIDECRDKFLNKQIFFLK